MLGGFSISKGQTNHKSFLMHQEVPIDDTADTFLGCIYHLFETSYRDVQEAKKIEEKRRCRSDKRFQPISLICGDRLFGGHAVA